MRIKTELKMGCWTLMILGALCCRLCEADEPKLNGPADGNLGENATRNLLNNSGFELGSQNGGWFCNGWQHDLRAMFQDRRFTDDTETYYEGKRSCRLVQDVLLTDDTQLASVGVPVTVEGRYYLSAWLKASRLRGVGLNVHEHLMDNDRSQKLVAGARYVVGKEWARYSLPVDLKPGVYTIHISVDRNFYDYEPSITWIDAVQLEYEKIREYKPRSEIEYGLVNVKENGVYIWKGERTKVPVKFRVSNRSGADMTGRFRWWLTDLWGNPVAEDIISCKVANGDTVERVIETRPKRKGSLKMFIQRIDSQGKGLGKPARLVFGLVPDASGRTDSFYGYHLHCYQPYYVNVARELGGRWCRTHDTVLSIGRWNTEEPAPGEYTYTPALLVDYMKDRLPILSTLFGKPLWVAGRPVPKEAPPDSEVAQRYKAFGNDWVYLYPVDMGLWERYVKKAVAHYKDQVKYWEIGNELDVFGADNYLEFLKTAHKAIKEADPKAIVVGGGGVGPSSFPGLEPQADPTRMTPFKNFGGTIVAGGALKYSDVFSIHQYVSIHQCLTENAPEEKVEESLSRLVPYLREQGFTGEVWNTEYMVGATASWYEDEPEYKLHMKAKIWGGSAYPVDAVTATKIHARYGLLQLGNGVSKCFIYYLLAASTLSPEPAVCTLEYDRIPHPILFAGAILEDKVAGSKCMGYIKWENSPVRAVVFSKGQGAWAGIWVIRSGEKYSVCLPEKGIWKVTDIMDNPVVISRKGESIAVEITDSPVYVENSSIVAEKLRQLLVEGLLPK